MKKRPIRAGNSAGRMGRFPILKRSSEELFRAPSCLFRCFLLNASDYGGRRAQLSKDRRANGKLFHGYAFHQDSNFRRSLLQSQEAHAALVPAVRLSREGRSCPASARKQHFFSMPRSASFCMSPLRCFTVKFTAHSSEQCFRNV